ncbi:ABC transporter permease [Lichenifustis flavocetrariae]|uniref:ABC transporter permease n=1 Tax=Lichenifustis flavocetrariae TaxID=2949735 RepID=A0AA41YV25_9HYPH|nr:ABC transporter permease [Lichenifustis flavocetrariae]MCW6507736.1 ABC transporter permease [Lichenifustis flavocetrariae]
MSEPLRPGLLAVALREVAWIRRDRVARLMVLVVPLVAFALLAMTFSNAVIRQLKVDVVDQDRSQASQALVRAIDAAPGVTIALRSADLNGAMHAVRSGGVIAATYIPQDFEHDLLAGRRPQVVIFYNKQFFTPGNVASGALQAAISAAVADLPKGPKAAGFTPGPLVVEQYVLTNPALNYAQFLLRAILPTVLHVMVAIAGGFAVGSEFTGRSVPDWLETAGGAPLTALVGKLAPYFGIFAIMMTVGLVIIHGLYQIPFRGDEVMIGVAACLLIVAYLSLGALFQLLVKNLATGLTLTGIVCSPAFGFAGVGFPVLAMGAFARGWGALLPLRWYIQILFDQAARGVPVRDSAAPFAMLGLLAVGFFGVAWLRLRSIARHPLPAVQTAREPDVPRRGIVGFFAAEYGRVLRDRGAFGLIVIGPLIYGVFYPQPYLGQLIRGVPIAVVDDDGTDLSRTLVETLNADEAIAVAARPTTLAEAQAALARREVFGILSIPAGTEREVLKGDRARLPAFVDSAYFLLYSRTLQGMMEATGTVSADIAGGGARSDGSLYRAALARSSQVEILNQPLFNPTGGYASYIVPAAFLLILQQTLLMGVATLGGVSFEQGGATARRRRSSAAAVIGQALAHLLLALPGCALYLIVLPRIYGFSYSERVLDILVLVIPYILAISFMGQLVGSLFKRRETAVLLLIAVSLPIFFLVGVAWPPEAIPRVLRVLSMIFPSTLGIDGLVRVNQMGASFGDVFRDWARLWVLVGIYAVLAIAVGRLASREEAAHVG